MGKTYCSVISALSFVGAAVAGYLTYLHYYPATAAGFVLCGGEYAGNCDALSQWEYATILGVPLAAYGLFLFLMLLFTALIADYAGGEYYLHGLLLIMPLIAVALAADAILAGVMIWFKTVCFLCIATYIINLLIALTVYFWYSVLKRREGLSMAAAYRALMPEETDGPDRKAAFSIYVLFVLLLAFAVFSTASVLQMKTYAFRQSKEQTQQTVAAFYRQAAEKPVLPPSTLTIGPADAKVQIAVFTDFLCSACYQFFQLERELAAKYGGKISFSYYNYPLDQQCNKYVQQTVYKSSCTAAKSLLASASLGVFPAYLDKHFSHYNEFHGQYGIDKAVEATEGMTEPEKFREMAGSAAIQQILLRDIELAEKLNIKATPTIFINGRRMEGVPPREVMEAIITRELKEAGVK